MTQDYPKPIAPPPEVIGEWWIAWDALDESERPPLEDFIADRASQYGADQELEACCELIDQKGFLPSSLLRLHRRPKPPSLKEQALEELEQLRGDANSMGMGFDAPAILRALEQLDD